MTTVAAQHEHTDGLPARRAAYAVLNDIFFRRRSFDEALARAPGLETLEPRDRAFARLLCATVLKRARQMDAALENLLHEPLADLKPAQMINIFRLGIAQLAFLETPAHAAVDTSVALAEAEGIAHHKPLVNAVMRRLAREGFAHMEPRDAGKANTPGWLWAQWMRDYGVETALGIAAAHLSEGTLDITVKKDPAHWAEKLEARVLPTGTLRRDAGGLVPGLPGFGEGAWWVQGASAALPARLLGDVRGRDVIDLCAAPGGKTAQLAAMGARVTAVDRSSTRMQKLRENLERLHLCAATHVADGAVWRPARPADAVLLDAPCTATGTIRHQPDVLHLKEPKDQEKMAALQRRLLAAAAEMLRPGGVLVYCTCSLQKAEGDEQAAWVEEAGLPLRPFPVAAGEIDGIAPMLTPAGDIRCLPAHWAGMGGMDGFYIARFTRL